MEQSQLLEEVMGASQDKDSDSSRSRSRSAASSSSSNSDRQEKSKKKVKRKTYKSKTKVGDEYLSAHWLSWSQQEIFTDLLRARNALKEFDSASGEKKIYRDISIDIFQGLSLFRSIFVGLNRKDRDIKKRVSTAIDKADAPLTLLETSFKRLLTTLRLGPNSAAAIGCGRFSGALIAHERRALKETVSEKKVKKTTTSSTRAKRQDRRCYNCNAKGHLSKDCRRRRH